MEFFLRLVHQILELEENVFFGVCLENQIVEENYCFFCDCHRFSLIPTIINNPHDWFNYIDLNQYWPTDNSEAEINKLRTAIYLTAETRLDYGNGFLYNFEFENDFIDDVVNEKNSRSNVLYSIAKRLLCCQKEAIADNGLRDEGINAKRGIRRFRTTGENRIHYTYSGPNTIRFLNYYREGEHDRGL